MPVKATTLGESTSSAFAYALTCWTGCRLEAEVHEAHHHVPDFPRVRILLRVRPTRPIEEVAEFRRIEAQPPG
ncbi:MAG TPA: hypothetical protein VHB50_17985 [Bryobacteraceae bacterium]|nr:hypothetical protein [Bryobacteraceae bacterium]